MANYKVNRGDYSQTGDQQLSTAAGKVIVGIPKVTKGTDWPVSAADLAALKKTFDDFLVSGTRMGRLMTAQKNAAKVALLVGMDKNATYTDLIADGDEVVIMLAGYVPISVNRTQSVLNPPEVIDVQTPQAEQLKLRVRADRNTKSFVGRIKKVTDPDFGAAISFASSRKIIFEGLTSGVTYIAQLMGIGGTTGQSDWSDPVQGMPK